MALKTVKLKSAIERVNFMDRYIVEKTIEESKLTYY